MQFVGGEDLKPEWVRSAVNAACSSKPVCPSNPEEQEEVLTVCDLAWNVVDPNFYRYVPTFVEIV